MERGTTVFSIEGGSSSPPLGIPAGGACEAWDDERLVQECLAGSQGAWSALIDKYRNLIYSIPIRQGLLQQDANEIFQEVSLKLVAELPRIREARSLAAWLIRVTVRECARWRGRRGRASGGGVPADFQDAETCADSAETLFAEIEREQALREAVFCLASRCQRLIRMLFFTVPRPSYDQIASCFAISRGSVGFIRMRCLERLRKNLEERGFR